MEKLLKPYDKEFMKMAMLKHEETFKQQVYELHRLYQIQKTLMKTMAIQNQEVYRHLKNKPHSDHQNNRKMIHKLDKPMGYELIDDATETDYNNGARDIDDESQIELTLGPTSFYKRVETKTRTSESGPSFSSSNSTGSSHGMKIRTTWTNERRREDLDFSFEAREEMNPQSKIKHYPPCLYQSLTLNLT